MKRTILLSLLFCLLSVGQTWADDIIPNVLTSSASTSNDASSKWDGSSLTLTSNSSSTGWIRKTWTTGSVALTLTNNYTSDITVSFKYTYAKANSTSTFIINGSTISTKATTKTDYSCDISAGSSITISLTTGKEANKETVVLSDFSYTTNETFKEFGITIKSEDTPSCTFAVSTNNDDAQIESNNSSAVSVSKLTTATTVSATATVPSGYKFFGWYTKDADNNETYISYSTDFKYTFTSDATVYIKCVSNDTPIFMLKTKGLRYTNLNDADAAATTNSHDIIVLISNGTLPSGNYTISSNNILLIPSDDAYTCSNTSDGPEYTASVSNQSAYRTLTLDNGANIIVNGSICLNGKMAANMGYNGAVTGAYGYMKMNSGSTITLNSGSYLYCWGFISGDGSITADNGAKVYENFQIRDFRGGSATSSMANNKQKVFPFNQYYIQNIEVSLTINHGAEEHVICWISTSYCDASTGDIIFIGTDSQTALFKLSSGSLTKKYDVNSDRQLYALSGNASLGYLELEVAAIFFAITVSSEDYVLPFTSNMSITLKNGSTFTTGYDLALIPGVEMTIEKGANFVIGSSSATSNPNVYVYDKNEWFVGGTVDGTSYSGYTYGTTGSTSTLEVAYSPTKKVKRTVGGLNSAKIDVQGNITAYGNLYTTSTGANICCSEGNGTVTLVNGGATTGVTYMAKQTGTTASYNSITVNSAQLHNGASYSGTENEYTATADASAGTTYNYIYDIWKKADGDIIAYAGNSKAINNINATDWDYLLTKVPNAIAVTSSTLSNTKNVLVKGSDDKYTCSNFEITDNEPLYIPTNFTATSASYKRSMPTSKYGTIILPYAPTVGGENDASYYALEADGVKTGGEVLHLAEVKTPQANTPYIFEKPSGATEININYDNNVDVLATPTTAISTESWTLNGSYQKQRIFLSKSDLDDYTKAADEYTSFVPGSTPYYIKGDYFYYASPYFKLNPFRAYILSKAGTEAKALSFSVADSEFTTAISTLLDEEAEIEGYYTVNGIKHEEMQKGLNIIKYTNGKTVKVFVK